MKVSVVVVTYNSTKYLPDFMEAVLNQSYWPEQEERPEIMVIDNASQDQTVDIIRRQYPFVGMLRNINNIGLPRAWNQGIKMTGGDYILIMNPDLILDRDFIKEAVKVIESDDSIGAVGGKLFQLKLDSDGDLHILDKTNILDSCGLRGFRHRQFIDRGAGEIDQGQYDKMEEVFGISGALGLYRRQALEQVKFKNEYFDEDFFLYKEDIDMACRLRLNGWKAVYIPQAIAYHHRRAKSQNRKTGNLGAIKQRQGKEDLVNYHSYKNHWLVLCKNSIFKYSVKDILSIGWYELKKLVYMLIFENRNLRRAVGECWKLRGKMKAKREWIAQTKRVSREEMERWFK